MNDGTGMDNMTAVIVKLRPTFDGNKAAKNMLPVEGSSFSSKATSATLLTSNKVKINSDTKSNGEPQKSLSVKRIQEYCSEESSDDPPFGKKAKLDGDEKSIESKSSQSASLKT